MDKAFSWLRRAMPFIGLLIVAGLIYDGVVFYSRWSRNREEQQVKTDQAAAQARKTVDAYGGLDLKILSFYATPGTIRRGTHTTLCYGVTGAKNVRIEPPIDSVWPALTRCVQASPQEDTAYKLVAEDDAGHSVTKEIAVKVRP